MQGIGVVAMRSFGMPASYCAECGSKSLGFDSGLRYCRACGIVLEEYVYG